MADVFMTVQGRSQDTTTAIYASAGHLGVESSHDWLSDYSPKFVDFPFTNPDPDFQSHLEVVQDVEPKVSVAPDIEDGRSLASVIEKADILLQYSGSVIVVPKSVPPSEVPDRFRVGIPLADFGSGAPWNLWAYRECSEVHLLGGGPPRQLRVREHCPAPIASVDTATLGQRCRFGMWDDGSCDAPNTWDYRRRLKESLDNYAAEWQS